MDELMDPSQPIYVYFKCIDECVQFAADAKTSYSLEQILQTTYYVISSPNIYEDECKKNAGENQNR